MLLDRVYFCNKGVDGGKVRNEFVSRPLPFLSRSYISFHHMCGYDVSSDAEAPERCVLRVEKDQHQEEVHMLGSERLNRSILLSVPESRLSNDGNVSKVTEWFFEYRPLPKINMNERLVLAAEFDSKHGGFGADNIHFHTPQR